MLGIIKITDMDQLLKEENRVKEMRTKAIVLENVKCEEGAKGKPVKEAE